MNAELVKADRHIMGLKVRTMEAKEAGRRPPRDLPPTPPPNAAPRKKPAAKR